MTKNDAINRLNNSKLDDKGVDMDLGVNKTPAEIIKEGAFGGTYFRDIYTDGPVFKTAGWLQGRLSLSSSRGR